MIRKITVFLPKGQVHVRELTIAQIRELLSAPDGISDGQAALALSIGRDTVTPKDIGDRPEEFAAVWDAFLSVNRELFSAAPENPAKPAKAAESATTLADLDHHICCLIQAGHTRVFNYGYSFFLAALKHLSSTLKP